MTNTSIIERAAVRAVKGYLDQCPKLEVIIDRNDKTPIWDGDVYIYKNKEHKNENFFARVPLMVKGTINGEDSSYRIRREYLEGFKAERGTALFAVQIDDNNSKIFYALLSSKNIEILLQQTTKTIRIDLNEVPAIPLKFEQRILDFATKRNREEVENTSPKEIQELVKGFDEIRHYLDEIENTEARFELEVLLDTIKNIKENDTLGWRDKFYYFSRKAIDLAINNIQEFDFAELQFNLGKYLQDQKQYHLAEDYYLNSLKILRNRAEADPYPWRKNDVASTLNNLANLHSDLTRYAEAEKEYKEALKIRRELARTNRDAYIGDVATTLDNLAILHDDLKRYDEAEKEFQEALEIRRELAKNNRDAYIADVATTLNNLAVLHDDLKRYDEAENEYKEALEIRRELAKNNRDAYIFEVSRTLNNLANLHKDLTRYDEAENEYKEALEIRRELAKNNRDAYIEYVARTLNNLAVLHDNLNCKDKAEEEYKEALEIRRELAKNNRDAYIADVAMTLNNLAILHKNLSRYSEAEKEHMEALNIDQRLAESNRDAHIANVATDLYNLAILYITLTRFDEAKKSAEEALNIYNELAEKYPQIWTKDVDDTKQLLKDLSN